MTSAELAALMTSIAPVVREFTAKAVQAAVEPVWLENRRLEMRVLELETRPPIVGPAGPQGERGFDGINGDIGPTGPAGVAGINGKDGAAGPNGKDGADAIMDSALLEALASYAKRLQAVETKTLLTDRVESDLTRLTQRVAAVETAAKADGDDLSPDDAGALFAETLAAAMKAAAPIQ